MRYLFEQPAVECAAALAALKADTFSESFAAANDPVELAAHLARAFDVGVVSAQLLDPRCDTTWVLDDGNPVGYLKVNHGTAQTEPGLSDGLEVEQVYVLASHHGQGLGGQLLDLATEKAREWGLTYLWLSVWEHNTNAISLYRHRGYEEFDHHVFMFGEEEQRDLLMRLDLVAAEAPGPGCLRPDESARGGEGCASIGDDAVDVREVAMPPGGSADHLGGGS